MTRRAGDERQ